MIHQVKKVWFDYGVYFAKNQSSAQLRNLEEQLASIFCPGPSYYYVLDFSNYQFVRVSPSYESIIGIEPDALTMDKFLNRIHPDDLDFMRQCETVIGKFLFQHLDSQHILNYKVSYCFRILTVDNTYKLFLHQALGLTVDEEGRLQRVLGIHADISHITQTNSQKLSFIGLNGMPSYTNIDVYQNDISFSKTKPELTKREIEVLKLIADGLNTKEIADKLNLSDATVRKHRENIIRKTKAKNTAHLISLSIRNGLI